MVSFITIVFILSLVDVGESDRKHMKYIPCRIFLNHGLEKSSMECSEEELIYVEKQVLLAEKYIFNLSENEMESRVYQDDIYLVIDRFYGNLTCNLIGPTMDMHMLELTETSIDVYSNGTLIYKNNDTNLYGENIMQYLNGSSDTGGHYMHLFIRINGRVWLQLRGERLQVNCTRFSPNLYFPSTEKARINFTLAYTEKRSRGKLV